MTISAEVVARTYGKVMGVEVYLDGKDFWGKPRWWAIVSEPSHHHVQAPIRQFDATLTETLADAMREQGWRPTLSERPGCWMWVYGRENSTKMAYGLNPVRHHAELEAIARAVGTWPASTADQIDAAATEA